MMVILGIKYPKGPAEDKLIISLLYEIKNLFISDEVRNRMIWLSFFPYIF